MLTEAIVGHLWQEAPVSCQSRFDLGIGVDGTWLKDVLALRIHLVLALLMVPARLLLGEVVLGGSFAEPGEILGVIYDGN
jgi:hypothetical protein